MTTTSDTAFNSNAPAAEQQEAMAELQKAHAPKSESDLVLPMDVLAEIAADVRQSLRREYDEEYQLAKAEVIDFYGAKDKRKNGDRGMSSVDIDFLQISRFGEYWERPSMLSFEHMRSMVDQTPVLSAIIMTRVRQVMRFCRPQESGHGLGFVVRHVDPTHELSDEESSSIALLQRFFTNCGWEFNPRRRRKLKRDSFSQFMARSVRDSLIMDSAPIETEMKRDRSLGIDGFYAVDGATIRLTPEDGFRGDEDIYALQVVQGRIMTGYTLDDLIYEPRNPRSDVILSGYGLSEVELLVKIVTGYLNALQLNLRGFSENAIPKGVLHLSGEYTKDDLVAFRRYWNSMVKGANSSWSVPVLVSKDQESKAAFEKFGVDFDEMYFAKWMTFLTSIACGIYGMSPSEINFDSFSGGTSSPLNGSDTEEKLADSKDKGLRPVLAYYESVFSDFIVSEFSDKFCFRFAGLDEADEDKRHELKKLVSTVNEIRAELNMEPDETEFGDAPVNPSLISPWMQVNGIGQQEQDFGGDGGAPGGQPGDGQDGEDGEEPDEDPGDGGDGGSDTVAEDDPDQTVAADEEEDEEELPLQKSFFDEPEELDFGVPATVIYRVGDE